jgi:hypothetical protein
MSPLSSWELAEAAAAESVVLTNVETERVVATWVAKRPRGRMPSAPARPPGLGT